jgi:quercetin dioxygenase-like cupin family protein
VSWGRTIWFLARRWRCGAGLRKQHERPYETAGYVVEGRAKLHLEGQTLVLEPGDSWIVPEGA